MVNMLAWQYFQIAFVCCGGLGGYRIFLEFLHEIFYFIMMELLFLL